MSGILGIRTLGTFGASGILSSLNDTDRQIFINYCPELKMLYPSLHSPHCFGADPDPLGCFRCVSKLLTELYGVSALHESNRTCCFFFVFYI